MDYCINITISALLYALGFMIPHAWWCSFVFTLPLYGMRKTWFDGLLWGLIAFGLHSSGVLWSVMSMQEGPWIVRCIPSVGIICFMALHSALWFMVQNGLERSVSWPAQCLLTPLIHTFFFWYSSYALLAPLGLGEGYPLSNPLLPVLQAVGAGRLLACAGMFGALYLLFVPAAWFYYGMRKKSILLMFGALTAVLLWCAPVAYKEVPPAWVAQVHSIPIQWSQSGDASVSLEMIEEIIHKNPDKKLFITPESALYNPDSIPLLKEHSYFTTPDTTVIVGSFSPTGDTFYNTLFCIQQGAVAHLHHKQHTVALVEGLPSWCSFTWLMKLHGGSPSIARGPRVNDTWRISDTLSLDPYTCSELFCSRAPRDNASPESTILICCNDSWFAGWMRYAARLMVADARLKAILWKKNCLYIGYQYAGYITTNGEFFPL